MVLKQTTNSYDPAGRLYQSGTTRFLYDGAQLVGEYNSSGTLVRRHVPGAALDEVVTTYNDATTVNRRWPVADERGSVVALTGASAAALNINRYDEYGVPDPGNSGRMQYTGQMWLPEAQLYHYKARAYAPQLGRFMQTDPIGYAAGANLYAYVGADPVNWIDPWGLCPDSRDEECPSQVDDVEVGGRQPPLTGRGAIFGGLIVGRTAFGLTAGGATLFFGWRLGERLAQAGDDVTQVEDVTVWGAQQHNETRYQPSLGVGRLRVYLLGRQVLVVPVPVLVVQAVNAQGEEFVAPSESPVWSRLRRFRGDTRTDGTFYYQYDRRHGGEIEVYNRRGEHIGAIDPIEGNYIKPWVTVRNIQSILR